MNLYIQITTRCQMHCVHCCFACTQKGEDMSLDTVKKAIRLAERLPKKNGLEIGGGEPTLHPDFWAIVGLSLAANLTDIPWLATNGSKTKDAIALARLAKRGVLSAELSLDKYHDPIADSVKAAFKPDNANTLDARRIRDNIYSPIRAGRAKKLPNDFTRLACTCRGLFVRPAGTIHVCGCADAPAIGSVHDYSFKEIRKYAERYMCYKEGK